MMESTFQHTKKKEVPRGQPNPIILRSYTNYSKQTNMSLLSLSPGLIRQCSDSSQNQSSLCQRFTKSFLQKEARVAEPLLLDKELRSLISMNVSHGRGHFFRKKQEQNIITYVKEIKPVLQCGLPICGIVAMTMAAQLLYDKGITDQSHPSNLLRFAQSNKLTRQGEILSAHQFVHIAQESLKCDGSVHHINELTLRFIIDMILCRNKAILVPYDSDKDHSPYLANGHQAHWCVIVGIAFCIPNDSPRIKELLSYCEIDRSSEYHFYLKPNRKFIETEFSTLETLNNDKVFVVARHGKSRHLGFWRLDLLLASAANLQELGPHRDPKEYMIPAEGICESLCSKFVVLQRRDSRS